MAGPEQNTWCTSRIRREARLNERHYGALQGDLKADPSLKERYGAEMLKRWRRSMDVAPPPLDADHEHWLPSPAPTSEVASARARETFFGERAQWGSHQRVPRRWRVSGGRVVASARAAAHCGEWRVSVPRHARM
jgi:hypothetical protein